MKKVTIACVVLGLLVWIFAQCHSVSPAFEKLEYIQRVGKLTVYVHPDFQPYSYKTGGGNLVGADVNIAQAIADELGVRLELKEADFDDMLRFTLLGRSDLTLSGFTKERAMGGRVDLSIPYAKSSQYLILPADSSIATLEDLANGRVGGIPQHTGYQIIAHEMENGILKDQEVRLVSINNASNGTSDLLAGQLDAIVMHEYMAIRMADRSPRLKAIPLVSESGTLYAETYSVAAPKKNLDLLSIVNAVLERLLDEGQIDEWLLEHSF